MTAMPQSSPPKSLPFAGQLLFGLLFWAAGVALLAVAAGWLHPSAGTNGTPRWVLAVAGLMFLSGGFVPMTIRFGADAWQSRLVGAIVLMGLAIIFNWIAFGSGARHFTSSSSFGGSPTARAVVSEHSGRIVFGLAAAAIDLFAIAIAIRLLRKPKP
jgi:hypothetical protein